MLFVEYFGCVDPCEIYVIVLLLRFEENWINWEIDRAIWFFLFGFKCVYYKILFSLAYPCFSCCVWTAMIVLCTRADDHIGAGEP